MLLLVTYFSLALWFVLLALICAATHASLNIIELSLLISAVCLIGAIYRYAQVCTLNEIRVEAEAREYRALREMRDEFRARAARSPKNDEDSSHYVYDTRMDDYACKTWIPPIE